MAEEKESKLETTEVSRAPRNRRKKTTTVSVAKNSMVYGIDLTRQPTRP